MTCPSLALAGARHQGPVDAYLYTDRGIYRPGETVHITAMMRNRAGAMVDDRAGSLTVYRPNGLEAEEAALYQREVWREPA